MKFSEDAIQAAAEALQRYWDQNENDEERTQWTDLSAEEQESWRGWARAALEAVR
jgi:hypothetical protein